MFVSFVQSLKSFFKYTNYFKILLSFDFYIIVFQFIIKTFFKTYSLKKLFFNENLTFFLIYKFIKESFFYKIEFFFFKVILF